MLLSVFLVLRYLKRVAGLMLGSDVSGRWVF